MDSCIALDESEVRRRAERLAIVFTDNDGTLTDGMVYYSESGEELKRYCVRDGHAVLLLRQASIETAIVTGEGPKLVAKRAEKLEIRNIFFGIEDKRRALPALLDRTRVPVEQAAYI